MRVLLADDDEDVRFVTRQLLELRGWQVVTAATGEAASRMAASGGFDVLALDHDMPPGTGLDVARDRREQGDDVPIVLWTGWAGTLDRDEVERLDVRLLNKADVRALPLLLAELAGRA